MDESGPIWLDCPDGYRPGWVKISEDGSHWVMTEMTDANDIAFWFPEPPPPHRGNGQRHRRGNDYDKSESR